MAEEYNPGEALVKSYRRLRVSGVLLILGALLLLLLGALLAPLFDSAAAQNRLGLHLLLDDGRGIWPVELWPQHLDYARQAVGNGGYVVQLVRSDDLDPARWQLFMDLCAARKLIPILRLATVYDRERHLWEAPPADADGGYTEIALRYAGFVAALDWPTDAHYVIVGNEPNHGEEWGGRPDPAAYARFLVDVAAAVKSADGQARVLNAPLDAYAPHTGSQPFENGWYYMDSETFIDEMVTAQPEVLRHIDVWASHPYPARFSAPPWEQTYQRDLLNDAPNPRQRTPPPQVYNRGVNGYIWELWKLSTYGIHNLPVMITETGWRHQESVHENALDAGTGYPDAETAAAYIDLALHGNKGRYPAYPEEGWLPWLDDERILAVSFFALDGSPVEWGHTNWLALDVSGAVLDTYAMFDLLTRFSKGQ